VGNARERTVSLHDQATGATHVVAQVMVEHRRDALLAQQRQVVPVEVVGRASSPRTRR
jgi:hypothetical protein